MLRCTKTLESNDRNGPRPKPIVGTKPLYSKVYPIPLIARAP